MGLKTHVVFFETKDYGWISYSVMGTEAKRLLRVNPHIFYIFKCNLLVSDPYIMKLKTPFNNYYKSKTINIYKEEVFSEGDNKTCIFITNDNDEGPCGFQIKNRL